MKKSLIAVLSAVGVVGAGLTIVAARFEPTIEPHTFVGTLDLGGLSKDEAARKLRVWWESEKLHPLELKNDKLTGKLPPRTPGMLGITLDDAATVASLPMTDLMQAVSDRVGSASASKQEFPLQFKSNGLALTQLAKEVKAIVPKGKAARVTFEEGAIIRKPEIGTLVLDEKLLPQVVTKALETGADEVQIPLLEGEKKVSDEQLAQIKEVVSEYSTHFPAYQTSRNTNIRLASAKLNGTVLMPGEKISFNQTVGQRTVQDGYRTAPVLVNGRHDTGIGGGICQVSTTLYNASLLSDLKIVKRQNHSIPSVYVPVGRDATVDWPNLDLVIQNNQKVPIAISSTYQSGKITFRILGQAHPERKVKILTENHQIWDRGEQTVVDRTLPPGARRVTEKGSRAHAIDVYRIVYENGVEVRRDKLSHSVYGGSPRIIGYNPAAPAPKPSAPVPGTPNALPAQDGQSNG